MSPVTRLLVSMLLLAPFTGCGDTTLAPTTGTVSIGGEAANSGKVVFRPTAGGQSAIGQIGPDGSFEMKVDGRTKGAQIGENHVLIVEATRAGQEPLSYRATLQGRVSVEGNTENTFDFEATDESRWEPLKN